MLATSTCETNLGDLWDTWRDQHGIPGPLLEMYRRHGDRPGVKCETCQNFDRGERDDMDCDEWDERCEVLSCDICPFYEGPPGPRCVSYDKYTHWSAEWIACGAYRGPGPGKVADA